MLTISTIASIAAIVAIAGYALFRLHSLILTKIDTGITHVIKWYATAEGTRAAHKILAEVEAETGSVPAQLQLLPDEAYPKDLPLHARTRYDARLREAIAAHPAPTTPGKYTDCAGSPWTLLPSGCWRDRDGRMRPTTWNPIIATFRMVPVGPDGADRADDPDGPDTTENRDQS